MIFEKGRMDYDSNCTSFYDGEWKDGKPHGFGYRHYLSGATYEGDWLYGRRHGSGIFKWADDQEVYSGQWENGLQVRIENDFYRNIYADNVCMPI